MTMAVKITTTSTKSKRRRVLVYGEAGTGKTTMIKTLSNPLIISSEDGLLPLEDQDIPVWEVSDIQDINEVLGILRSDTTELKGFDSICVDSWSEVAEMALAEYGKPEVKNGKEIKPHGQAVYGALGTFGKKFLSAFRDGVKDKNIYMTARMIRHDDPHDGVSRWSPDAPGATLRTITPHYFDIVAALRIGEYENENSDRQKYRYLQTQPCIQYYAKDRSRKLDDMENADLSALIQKSLKS
jgi:phage nucleotide-binding protein